MNLAKRFRRLYAGVVYDALAFDVRCEWPFTLHRSIAAQWPHRTPMVGPAFTCTGRCVPKGGAQHDTYRLTMLNDMPSGCVQVIDAAGDDTVAHFGDVSAHIARLRGCVGVAIDGYTRDIQRIERQRLPIYARGVQPQDAYGRWEIAGHGSDVVIGGVLVSPGDWLFGDRDGVLLIPRNLVEAVCRAAEVRAAKEAAIRRQLHPGNELKLYRRYGRW